MMAVEWVKQRLPEPIKNHLKRILRRPVETKPQPRPLPLPDHLAHNHRGIDAAGLERIRESLAAHYHVGWRSQCHYSVDGYESDVLAHLCERQQHDRNIVIPWLDSLKGLSGSRVLEIGCGTGSSTVALAEQGAAVVGIDVDQGSLSVARDRCAAYGIDAEILFLNAEAIERRFTPRQFDYVIFFACLEHMTIDERLASLGQAWRLLPSEGILAIVETPNRLWFKDDHTSRLPFFHWLPNDLAFRYSRFSPRENFQEVYREYTNETEMHFLRRGRGCSFHEIDLAIAPVGGLDVTCSLSEYQQARGMSARSPLELKYLELLKEICPDVHPAFLEPNLDLAIVKKDGL